MLPAPLCHIQQDQHLQQLLSPAIFCFSLMSVYSLFLRFLSPVHLARLRGVQGIAFKHRVLRPFVVKSLFGSIDGASVYGIGEAHEIKDPVSSDSVVVVVVVVVTAVVAAATPLTHVAALQQCVLSHQSQTPPWLPPSEGSLCQSGSRFGSLWDFGRSIFPFFWAALWN
ncbi:hypothetical protein BASA62_002751 [Batrachochytrium salamandrivorans]|nr:hypothetical protein BASA62_002751 [Batrachochytrium salamandrivorans]